MKNRYRITLVITAVLALAVSEIGVAQGRLSNDYTRLQHYLLHKKQQPTNKVELLFVQQAVSGSLVPDSAKKGCFLLKLSSVRPHILYFSNEPKRITGQLTTAQFLRLWMNNKKHYNISQPNVAIQAFSVGRGVTREFNQASTLSDPKINDKTGMVIYTACPIANKANKTVMMASNLHNITLFFDAFHGWPP